jgi:hypothetical protein
VKRLAFYALYYIIDAKENRVKKILRVFLIILLASLSAVSIYKYIVTLKQKKELIISLNQTRNQVSILEIDKKNLIESLEQSHNAEAALGQENAVLKTSLKENEERINKLEVSFKDVQNSLEKLSSQNTALTAENIALREQRDNLDLQVYNFSEDNEAMRSKLSSISELKKAIKELKKGPGRQMPPNYYDARRPQARVGDESEGNSGFILKEGQPTYSSKARIEVEPF